MSADDLTYLASLRGSSRGAMPGQHHSIASTPPTIPPTLGFFSAFGQHGPMPGGGGGQNSNAGTSMVQSMGNFPPSGSMDPFRALPPGIPPMNFYPPGLGPPPSDQLGAQMSHGQPILPPYLFDPCFPGGFSPYHNRFGGPLDINGARRKNATRETTAALKAWLYEHKKNPYPNKGEKVMLALFTNMTLTQVSTWFANARRRLKKENKMTWSPRNRSGEDDDDDDRDDDDDITSGGNNRTNRPGDSGDHHPGKLLDASNSSSHSSAAVPNSDHRVSQNNSLLMINGRHFDRPMSSQSSLLLNDSEHSDAEISPRSGSVKHDRLYNAHAPINGSTFAGFGDKFDRHISTSGLHSVDNKRPGSFSIDNLSCYQDSSASKQPSAKHNELDSDRGKIGHSDEIIPPPAKKHKIWSIADTVNVTSSSDSHKKLPIGVADKDNSNLETPLSNTVPMINASHGQHSVGLPSHAVPSSSSSLNMTFPHWPNMAAMAAMAAMLPRHSHAQNASLLSPIGHQATAANQQLPFFGLPMVQRPHDIFYRNFLASPPNFTGGLPLFMAAQQGAGTQAPGNLNQSSLAALASFYQPPLSTASHPVTSTSNSTPSDTNKFTPVTSTTSSATAPIPSSHEEAISPVSSAGSVTKSSPNEKPSSNKDVNSAASSVSTTPPSK